MLGLLRAPCCFSLVLLLSTATLAQSPSPGFADVSGARASFEQGMQAYREGRFRAAVEHFQEADRLAPSPRLSYNVALAYERMRDGPHALAAYRDYLRRLPQADNAAATSIRIAELELELQISGVQQLTVLSTPAGARVWIDEVARGVSPWSGELPPGPHRLTLELVGYERYSESFELPARHAIDLTPKLRPIAHPVVAPLPVPAPPPAPPASLAPRWWTWAAFGTSAALLVGSGAFELSRRSLESELAPERELPQAATLEKYEAMTERKTTARVLLATSLATGVVAGVCLYFDLQRDEPGEAGLALACAGPACQALARGHW